MRARGFKAALTPFSGPATVVAVLAFALLWIAAMIRMPGRSYQGPLPALSAAQGRAAARLRAGVETLSTSIGERHTGRPRALAAAADWIAAEFAALGYPTRRLTFQSGGIEVANIEAVHTLGARQDALVVVGAHYDSVPGSPAANDNASGVVALLEIARRLRATRLDRPLRLVAFVNEEPPHYRTETMGSRVYARLLAAGGSEVAAMISLETLGYYSDEPGSQRYPFPLALAYPEVGNFVGFVGNFASARLVREAVATFRERARFPSEGAALPAWIPGVAWSDQASFWEQGWPALMVTDTAPFRYPWYHSPADTADKVDVERLARVVDGLVAVIERLASPPADGPDQPPR